VLMNTVVTMLISIGTPRSIRTRPFSIHRRSSRCYFPGDARRDASGPSGALESRYAKGFRARRRQHRQLASRQRASRQRASRQRASRQLASRVAPMPRARFTAPSRRVATAQNTRRVLTALTPALTHAG
jgi:hypothetical protein